MGIKTQLDNDARAQDVVVVNPPGCDPDTDNDGILDPGEDTNNNGVLNGFGFYGIQFDTLDVQVNAVAPKTARFIAIPRALLSSLRRLRST